MVIFNTQVFGVDAERFLAKTKEEKKDWILKHTNQSNETLINDFIDRLPEVAPKEESNCINCGTLNDKIENPFKDGESISNGNVEESSTSEEQTVFKPKGKRNRNK